MVFSEWSKNIEAMKPVLVEVEAMNHESVLDDFISKKI